MQAGAADRRTQRERSTVTVGQLVGAARVCFARHGYAVTSLDAICELAEVSKGALYHHFTSKEELFRTVYQIEQRCLAHAVAEEYRRHDDPWEALFHACRVFLENVLDPSVQRIVLLDAPSALGVDAVRDVRGDCREMMRLGVTRAVSTGRIAARPVEPLVALLHGALCASAIVVAHADNRRETLRDTLVELRRLFGALEQADRLSPGGLPAPAPR
jgi:AcrR family transcriptional regulator